jgi:hypothetical protein
VMFIPKPGKLDYTEAKACHPISLSSFLLKIMEKLVERHIRDSSLREYSLHRNQHAYQIGKSTETALHNVVTCKKMQLNTGTSPSAHSLTRGSFR